MSQTSQRTVTQNISHALERIRELLQGTAVRSHDRYGWRQFLDESGAPGTYGTACGLIAYANTPGALWDTLQCASATILATQREDGSWESPTIAEGVGLTTATAYSLMALRESRVALDPSVWGRAVTWFDGLVQANGATGDYMGHTEHNTTCAAMVLRAIGESSAESVAHRVTGWLLSGRGNDGGWGYYPNSHSTVEHTALVLLALAESGYPADCPEVKEGVGFLRARYTPGGPANNHLKDLTYVHIRDGRRQLPFHFFTDALVGLAYLCVLGRYDLSHEVLETAGHLLATQAPEGHWVHAALPLKRPTWAASETAMFLARTGRLLTTEGRLIDLEHMQQSLAVDLATTRDIAERVDSRTRGLPMALRILRQWPFHAIYAFLLVFITIKSTLPMTPWVGIAAVVVSAAVSVLAGFVVYRKGKSE